MKITIVHRVGAFLAIVAAALLAACAADSSVSPNRGRLTPATRDASESVALGVCQKLNVTDAELAFHAYASGVQIYRWTGSSWALVGPSAQLFADAGNNAKVGTHYVGPTWESKSGSKVVGAVIDRCTPEPNAIPWLLLGAVSSDGAGVFNGVTRIQRLNTVGGLAPATPGAVVGDVVSIPYSAEYFFYRPE